MARPRKPEALRRLHGDKPDRFNLDEPTPLHGDEPVMPDALSEAQRAEWNRTTHHLRAMGMLHAADGPLILAYVVAVEKLDRLRIKMTTEPEVVRNPSNGMPMENPVFGQWLKTTSKMEALSNKLGLNPSARSGIRATIAKPAAVPVGGGDRFFGA